MPLSPIRTTLDNGVVVLARHTSMTPAVAIHLAVRAGSAGDPADAPGLTWLLSRVIDRGTASRSAAQIAEELDSRGITVAAAVTRHLFSLVCTCLAEDVDAVLDLVGDMVMSPTIPPQELATRKGEVITAIRQDEDNPAVRASEALMALLYPDGHPYGRPTKGSVESVEALTRDRLLALHGERFGPRALTAVIVGDVDVSRAQAAAARVFGRWAGLPIPAARLPQVVRAASRRQVVIPMMNKAQADIAYGFTTITRRDPAYYAYWLMNVILGQYALGGRLGDTIRERQGMAYYVTSSFDANVVEGPLVIRAGVSAANVDRTVASIDAEIRRLVADGVTPKELDEAQRFLIGSIPRALETNAAIAAFLQNAEFFELGLDYDARLPDLLRTETRDRVNEAARCAVDAARASIIIAGPYQ